MKKLLTFLFVLSIGFLAHAQWVFQPFDNAVQPNTSVGTNWADTAKFETNFYAASSSSIMALTNDPDSYDGGGSMKISYHIVGSGWMVRTDYHEATIADLPYIDLSAGTELSIWYKVVVPADTATVGAIVLELKLAEFNDLDQRDVFYHQTKIDLTDQSGQWINYRMPLIKTAQNTDGFALQFGDNDQELQLDHIKGFEIAIASNGSTADPQGEILLDKLELVGNRYNPFQTFDDAATNTFVIDDMSPWAGTGASSVALSNNTTDFVEGTGALQLDYTVNASQGWGGYLNFRDTTFTLPDSFANRTALVLYVKNINPLTGTTPERVTMRFFLLENSTGANEDWVIEVPINFEQAGEWTRYLLPLKMDTVYTDENGKQRFPQNGFAQKWWEPQGDNTFNQEFVTGYKIELSAGGTEYGPQGETFTGRLLFDVLQQSGFKFDDKEAPAAPVVNGIAFSYENYVTWLDVPGEFNETYNVYASLNPITNVAADGVDLIASGIGHGNQVFTHVLKSANVDRAKTFYYAVTCKDLAGNVSEPGTFGPLTNTAKGVPTVSITPPSPFVADGNLSEWTSAQPSFIMQSALGTANVVLNVDGDADCSAEVKVAIDNTYLYVMMDVTDDIVFWDDNNETYENDAPDLFIGLYNYSKIGHIAYWHGSTPDYHLRFGKFFVRNDQSTSQCDSMIANGTENYYYGEKFPAGYIVEARIPLVDLATKRNPGGTSTDTINWKAGDRIPFDIGINDNDGNNTDGDPEMDREGMIFYTPTNKDQGWQNVSVWTYTWIGDEVTGVEDNASFVNSFDLKQNYPNPFNPSTKITYSIAEPGLVSIKVFDILGRQIANLVNEQKAAGTYSVDFDAQNLSAGVYLYRIESGTFQATRKMILLK